MKRLACALVIALMATAACGDGGGSSDETTAPNAPASSAEATPPSVAYPPGAITGSSLMIEGSVRRFLIAVPPDYEPSRPAGLILDLHGRGATAADQALTSRITDPAWREGFVVVHPQAQGGVPTWPVFPELDGFPAEITFFETLLDHVAEVLAIDGDRVFVTGFSNGGGMAGRLACELASRIAGIAPVGASNEGWEQCDPARPVPVLAFHGAADDVVPIEGGRMLPAISDWARWWAEADGCSGDPQTSPTASGRAHHWARCDDGATVTLVVVDAWGHQWPDRIELISEPGEVPVWRGATEIIVDFFAAR